MLNGILAWSLIGVLVLIAFIAFDVRSLRTDLVDTVKESVVVFIAIAVLSVVMFVTLWPILILMGTIRRRQ